MLSPYKARNLDLHLHKAVSQQVSHYSNFQSPDLKKFKSAESMVVNLSKSGDFDLPDLGITDLTELGDFDLPELGIIDLGITDLNESGDFDLPELGNFDLHELSITDLTELGDLDLPELGITDLGITDLIDLGNLDLPELGITDLTELGDFDMYLHNIENRKYVSDLSFRMPNESDEWAYVYECFSVAEEREIVSFLLSRNTNRYGKKALYPSDLQNYIQARSKEAKEADDDFLKQLCNIQTYEFHPMKLKLKAIIYKNGEKFSFTQKKLQIKAVIDFLKLEFVSNVKTTRFKVKEILTKKTGTKHYTESDESGIQQENSSKFIITLHDVNDSKELKKIINLLVRHFKADLKDMRITNIELSLDFYNAQNNALLVALFKSLRLKEGSSNFRMYKNFKGKFSTVERDPLSLLQRINDDWCIGVNRKDSEVFYRLYHKTTDKNQQLDSSLHRHRVEVNLSGEALASVDCHPYNLGAMIKYGFKNIQFTKPSINATANDKQTYTDIVEPYGLEHLVYSTRNHRKRVLLPYLRPQFFKLRSC